MSDGLVTVAIGLLHWAAGCSIGFAFIPGPWTRYHYLDIEPLYGRFAQYPRIVVEPSTEYVDESSVQNCLP